MRSIIVLFLLFFAMVVTVTILTDPDPAIQDTIQTFEVKDEYDFTWKSSIGINDEHTSRNTKTTMG